MISDNRYEDIVGNDEGREIKVIRQTLSLWKCTTIRVNQMRCNQTYVITIGGRQRRLDRGLFIVRQRAE